MKVIVVEKKKRSVLVRLPGSHEEWWVRLSMVEYLRTIPISRRVLRSVDVHVGQPFRIFTELGVEYLTYMCRNCSGQGLDMNFRYCPHCGVKLRWITIMNTEMTADSLLSGIRLIAYERAKNIAETKERALDAFIEETGLRPSECEVVIRTRPPQDDDPYAEVIWLVRKRSELAE